MARPRFYLREGRGYRNATSHGSGNREHVYFVVLDRANCHREIWSRSTIRDGRLPGPRGGNLRSTIEDRAERLRKERRRVAREQNRSCKL